MKRALFAAVLTGALPLTLLFAQTSGKQKPPCKASLADCPDEGCGEGFDPNLNRLKNIRSGDLTHALRTLAWMRKLDNPEHFEKGDSREELTALGEGQTVTVAAYLLKAKPETGGESCNCGLHSAAETDNHLVLVTKATVKKFPLSSDKQANKAAFSKREAESLTAEFTPRVRLTHPNFTLAKMQPLIDAAKQKALLVRVTGLLLFDSEHFLEHPLVRKNNWEIHPVLKMEVCTMGDKCKPSKDDGWKSIDD